MEREGLKLEVAFYPEYYQDCPDNIWINLTEDEIAAMKIAQQFVQDNKGISSVRVDVYPQETDGEWYSWVNHIIVYGGSFVYYSQSKYDAHDQIESDFFKLNEKDEPVVLGIEEDI